MNPASPPERKLPYIPERVLAALAAFEEPLVLLSGGRDKDLPWERFARRVVERVRVLILFGEASTLIREAVLSARKTVFAEGRASNLEDIVMAGSLKNAVLVAAERAQRGEVVLLSPGGTSFDAFRDFAERGQEYRSWVNRLPGPGGLDRGNV